MNFLELAADRYSVRKFKNQPIEEEKLEKIIEAARLAPTACNNQPQKIYVVKSAEKRAALKGVCQCTFDAPVIVAIGYDVERTWKNKLMPGYQSGETDAAIVCTHMMFEAWEQGIGSCWVGWFNADQVEEVLGLPENVTISALLPMGYPEEGVQPANLHTLYRENSDMVEIL
ncbi:MAG: nitroreductase family protein [Firmicutes bacterium]|nr:nitroreductase family protein [Bacillota bacterium]